MRIKNVINTLTSAGVRESYLPWEIFLTRKLNALTFVGIFNVCIAIIFFYYFKYYQFIIDCVALLVVAPGVIILNVKKNYRWAAYYFYLIGFVYFASLNLKVGLESFLFLYYFPFIISMIQLLGRREMIKDFIALGLLFLFTIVAIVIGHHYNWVRSHSDATPNNSLILFNLIFSIFTTLVFMSVVVIESITQEEKIRKMLSEKDVLLAEVYHRVKNNMNIVTSLLSLRKDMSTSLEVQEALDDCRNRVYSMALVHQKMYNSKNLESLNFKDYIYDLVKDIKHSLGGSKELNVTIDAENINLELGNAIPCGLILNELITNAYKHADTNANNIQVLIVLKKTGNVIDLIVKDNGPGINEEAFNKPNALGIELIKSLTEQLEGKYTFTNQNGLVFKLSFKQV